MLDLNSRSQTSEHVNAAIDAALVAGNAASPPRSYLGGSRLGHACERALQFEFVKAPKDEGADFDGRLLRIFGIGHALEDVAVAWLRGAGFELFTRRGGGDHGAQFGFSVAGGRIRGHVDGVLAGGPAIPGMAFPALWECKTMNAKSWRETAGKGVAASKPIYAAQIAVYQAYMDASVPGVADNPALFTAINKDTAELHHELVPFNAELAQRMSDRGVRILAATDAGDLLPRIAAKPDHFECRFCPWDKRCWRLQA
ncbi:hypothetical protein [Sediminicoccus sp. BL-A-41-H5]|uniref:hypothetical protein n=1 Tax=Sediminicoccus sp. BL-A-41-H5 TaxID=3421106 RepID=UPI003D678BB1